MTQTVELSPSHCRVQIVPTLTLDPYADDCVVGGLQEIDLTHYGDGRAFEIDNIQIHDKSGENKTLDLLIFDAEPTEDTVLQDAEVLDIVTADKLKLLAVVVGGAFAVVTSSEAIYRTATRLGINALPAANKLFVALVNREADVEAPLTFTAVNDLTLAFDIVPL